MRTLPEGLSWLCEKTWEQVSREERYFCAELFFVIQKDNRRFVQFLREKAHWPIPEKKRPIPEMNWNPAYEVSFYRDIAKARKDSENPFTQQRSFQQHAFDLALFSNEAIILIEAKAHQRFTGRQLKWLDSDRENVRKLTKVEEIFLVGLISSKYWPEPPTRKHFDLIIRWRDLACWYGDDARAKPIFSRADVIFDD